ncbi:hypothetical protein ACVWZ3_005689 [Bradyrhizobium sp. i1.3.6]
MVDVVEAMIVSGPTCFEAAPSTSRLSSTTSGTPSKTIPAPDNAAPLRLAGTTETRAISGSTSASFSSPSFDRLAKVFLTSSSASASSLAKSSAERPLMSIIVTICPA